MTNKSISACPEFNHRIDAIDPLVCEAKTLFQLTSEAPCEHSRGYLAGIVSARISFAALTDLDPSMAQAMAEAQA